MKFKLSISLFLKLNIIQLFTELLNHSCETIVSDEQYDILFQQNVPGYLNQSTLADRTQSAYKIPAIIKVIIWMEKWLHQVFIFTPS